MATRGTMIGRIISELHLESASYTAQVINAIDSAVNFYRPERFWFTEGVTSVVMLTTGAVTLSSDLPDSVTIDLVRATDNSGTPYPLTYETWDVFEAHESMTAEPSSWALHHQLLHVWPTNDQTRTIEVSWSGRITMTASNSSSCVWTNEAEELIRLHAKCDLCENFLLDVQAADRYRGREGMIFNNLLSETIKRLNIGQNMKAHL
jgi:hypothetical protein